MRPEDLSRTHWIVIGLLLGLGLSFMRVYIGPPDPSQTHTLANLEKELLKDPTKGSDGKEYPWVTDLLVYPPQQLPPDTPGSSVRSNIVLVTFMARTPAQKQWQWTPGAIHLREPVNPLNRRISGSDYTVPAYLDAVAAATNNSARRYTYAWWSEPKWVYVTWTAMTTFLVGGIWPLMLALLIGAGFGRRSEERKPSLWARWKSYRQDAARRARAAGAAASDPAVQKKAAPASTSLSDDEMARLSTMEAELHDFLAQGSGEAKTDAGAAPAKPAIRELTAGPAEAPKVEQTQEEKSYGGDFYPTVAHGKRNKTEDDDKR
jgi:hypothetical protein